MKQVMIMISLFLLGAGPVFGQTANWSEDFKSFPRWQPFIYSDPLGHGPQFNFLWNGNNAVTAHQFVDAVKKPANWRRAPHSAQAMAEMNRVLTTIGFPNGYEDLKYEDVTLDPIPWGTTGNLGTWNRKFSKMLYEYVVLTPAGESKQGIRAFKITSPSGQVVYLCTRCGNVFYPAAGHTGTR